MTEFLGWLLGFENAQTIDSIGVSFASEWASHGVWNVAGVCLLAVCGVVVFYRRFEQCKSTWLRMTLTVIRAAALCLVLVTLAAPLVRSSASIQRQPLVHLVLDDSKSMGLPESSKDGACNITDRTLAAVVRRGHR